MTAIPVTLLIPTRNRPAYLERCLSFYQPYLQHMQVIVLDSSDDNASEKICQQFEGVNYQHYAADMSFAGKLALGGRLSTQPFVTVCSDDDFIFFEGITACVKFLADHDDTVCAHGKYLRHWFDDNNQLQFYETYTGNHANMLDADIPASVRLQCHFDDYTPTFYAVTRTRAFIDAYQCTTDLGVEFGLSEVLPSSLTVLAGKIARVPVMYASRESHRHNWVTEERKQQMYSADKIAVTVQALKAQLPADEHGLVTQLLSVGKGMTCVPLTPEADALRAKKTAAEFAQMKITQEEADWAVNLLAQILLDKQGYSRQEMIKLRESLYLS